MKNVIVIGFVLLLCVLQMMPGFAQSTKGPASAPLPVSANSQSVLQDALALVEIYYKIRTLTGQNESSQLQPHLQRLNLILDQVIAFKASFTPEKWAKIQKDLDGVKKELAKFTDIPPAQMKSQLPHLSDLIWKLARTLLE